MTADDASFTLDGQARMIAELSSPGGPGDSHFTKAFNAAMIERMRAGKGRIEGELGNRDRLLLTVTGRVSGQTSTSPVSYLVIEGRLVVIASMGGADRHPQWYLNLLANPRVTVELSGVEFAARAIATQGAERARLFAVACQHSPGYAAYQAKTAREIPVIELRAELIDLAAVLAARRSGGEAMESPRNSVDRR
jgi:deazaflavin-dependent oxidoreductase (nitroreductase family)